MIKNHPNTKKYIVSFAHSFFLSQAHANCPRMSARRILYSSY